MINLWHLFILGKGEVFVLLSPQDLLLYILLVPIISILIIFIFNILGNRFLYEFALFSTVLSFLLSLLLWFVFEESKGGFQYTYSFFLIPSVPFSIRLGVDGISIFLYY